MPSLRIPIVVLALVFALLLTLRTLPRLLDPSSTPEKLRRDARWIASSPYFFDRQACRWFGLCGLHHLHSDPACRNATTCPGGQEGDAERGDLRRWLEEHKDDAKSGAIPDYVLAHAPLVHLSSNERFWPADIEEHIKHLTAHIKNKPINSSPPLTLADLDDLNRFVDPVALNSDDDVEARPAWLHSGIGIPEPFESPPTEFLPQDLFGPPPVEDTTWFDVDRDHPLQRISDPRQTPKAPKHQPHFHSRSLPQKPISSPTQNRQKSNSPTAGRSAAPAILLLVPKSPGILDAYWFYFYSYNLGQTVLSTRYGNHVGDWEHALQRFEYGQPRALFLSEHEGGQAYTHSSLSKYASFPQRPVVYSAVGSHAMYALPGDHAYVLPFSILKDQSDAGPLWDPAKNVRSYWYDYENPGNASLVPTRENAGAPTGWFHYEGLWGDDMLPLRDERQWRIFGQYHYVGGPRGPKGKSLGRAKMCPRRDRCLIRYGLDPRATWYS